MPRGEVIEDLPQPRLARMVRERDVTINRLGASLHYYRQKTPTAKRLAKLQIKYNRLDRTHTETKAKLAKARRDLKSLKTRVEKLTKGI